MAKILIIEDQKDMVTGLVFNLEAQGHKVSAAYDGEAGLSSAVREKPDLIVLDIMLPKKDGFEVCRELRRKGHDVPILMLTARREEADKVRGLEIGADDYLTKPFGLSEFLARVKALLRRGPGKDVQLENCRFGMVEVDFKNYRASKEGVSVNLSQREFEMMRLFLKNRDKVISRNRFLNEIWGYDRYPTTRTVDAHIASLRKKLETDPEHPQFIITAHGLGYKFIG
ncbi:MAG: response regulator transcription factor [Candidatus Aminicenantes bacterium]|nr:response regulator transcription factor [Candidatus Aminicenantes bacterium]